ncbi:MAG: WGR domain-containing protein [Gammaproteobacteria bacterium]
MNPIYLERRDPEKNLARFYALTVTRTIFGDCAVIREWGRIGSPGTVREDWFDTEDAAQAAKREIFRRKEKRGYFNPDGA